MKKIFLIIILMILPVFASAATITVQAKTGNEVVNAIEGTFVVPASVSISRILTGGSAILVWIKEPTYDARNHTISFAGITPGGFSRTAPLFTLESNNSFSQAAGGSLFGYRNDGRGTEINLEYDLTEAALPSDTAPPEPFNISIFTSPDIGPSHFLTFAASDKGTGVVKYEYASTWLFNPGEGDWHEVISPLTLGRLDLFKELYIRATDSAGNYRISRTPGTWHYAALVVGTILIVCALWFALRSFL